MSSSVSGALDTTVAVVLARHLDGLPSPDDFALTEVPLPPRPANALLVRVTTLSLDPYVRGAISGRHMGDAPVPIGDVVPGRSIGVVVESDDTDRPVGCLVMSDSGWRGHAVVRADATTLVRVPSGFSPSAALGPLGMPGLTAYAALERHLRPRPGETVVVSSATGGVGSVAGQLARAVGAHTVALVGSAAKADDAIRLGYEQAVVRTEPDWVAQLSSACPQGVHAYLHMGDQQTLNGVLGSLAIGARVSLCGLMDQYNDGPRTTLAAGAIMSARATVHGMVVYDHWDLLSDLERRVQGLAEHGKFQVHEERHQGLASAPFAFTRLMAGHNRGKVIVELDVPDAP